MHPQQLLQALAQMTPAQIVEVQRALGQSPDGSGRSPIRPRQLTDLRLLPTATDPRPTFFWSVETPREWVVGPGTAYPRLLWNDAGDEITVHDREDHRERVAQGYTLDARPSAAVADPVLDLTQALQGLPEREQQAILAAQAQQRTEALTSKLAALPPAQLERLLADLAPAAGDRKKKPA